MTLADALADLEAAQAKAAETRVALEAELAKWGLGVIRMSTTRISQRELESYLWGAAVVLRGLIDAGDYKQYIFPLVFLKRISDVYDEEHAAAMEIYGDEDLADLPENHRFAIPDGCHWDDIRSVTQNIGATVLKAMRAIESANPDTLPGVFGDGDWGNKNLLPDSTLADLIEHFSSKTLSIANLPEDELGNGYEYLIKKFADDSGHTAQEFYTNRTLVHLMTLMLEPQPGESVYDPTCGTGGMLISAAAEVKRQGKEWRNLRLYGQELNYGTSAIARMNLFLHGITDGHIAHGDTLPRPRSSTAKGRLQTFDVVLANPPYSIKAWNRAAFAKDPYGRNMWGVPPQGRADYAFFQHIAKSLDPKTGRAAILFPHGVLFRREEAALREALVKSDLVECVLGLGAGPVLQQPDGGRGRRPASQKPAERKGKVLFINAVNEVAREQAQSFLRESSPAEDPRRLPRLRGPGRLRHGRDTRPDRAQGLQPGNPALRRRSQGRRQPAAIDVDRGASPTGVRLQQRLMPPSAKSSLCCERRYGVSLNLDKSAWKRVTLGRRRSAASRTASTRQRLASTGTCAASTSIPSECDHPATGMSRTDQMGRRSLALPAGPGALRVSRRTYLRKVGVADFDGICADKTFVLETAHNVLLQDFLPFLLRRESFSTTRSQSPRLGEPRTQLARPAALRVRSPAPRRAEAHRRPPLGRRASSALNSTAARVAA